MKIFDHIRIYSLILDHIALQRALNSLYSRNLSSVYKTVLDATLENGEKLLQHFPIWSHVESTKIGATIRIPEFEEERWNGKVEVKWQDAEATYSISDTGWKFVEGNERWIELFGEQ